MAERCPPGCRPTAAEAARDTLGGAAPLAAELPARLGAALLDAGRIALLRGLQATSAIGAALLLAMAAVVLITLRRADAARLCADNLRP